MPYNSNSRRNSRYSYHSVKKSGSRQRTKQRINPELFVKAAKPVKLSEYNPTNSFSDFNLAPLLHENLMSRNFGNPSAIQDQAIPVALSGRDVIGVANTGTGKTMAFALPVLNKIITTPGSKALIMAPTRELAEQTENEIRKLAKGSGICGALLIGGAPIKPQLNELRSDPRVVIGTPGRILDHINRHTLKLADFNIVVLDEVDRMLDMGFVDDMRTILGLLNKDRQSLYFSATMGSEVISLIRNFSHDPVSISVKTSDTSENVEQNIIRIYSGETKIEKLHDLLINAQISKALVFDETQRNVERLSQQLLERGFQADAIHGGKSQSQRKRALTRFKNSQVNILVATDVAARGLNVSDISHVINYSTPQTYDDYIHRIGRAGRAGRKGYALTFVES